MALTWSALIRVPIVLNAGHHLDSDLAVDGLTLLEATRGHWRWHYPATPHMGILPVLLSWPQAWAFGTDPITLTSGGAVAWGCVVAATFVATRRAFGGSVAAWAMVPLACASTGEVWLSGRITGGHLLTLAWHAVALAMLHANVARGGVGNALTLGLWCGLGLYLDSMFAASFCAVLLAAIGGWWASGHAGAGVVAAAAFAAACGVGFAPREIGRRVDPHDAYGDTFAASHEPRVLADHARIMLLDCIPRLVAGHRLPGLQADPDPAKLEGVSSRGSSAPHRSLTAATTATALLLFIASIGALIADRATPADPARTAVKRAALIASAVVAGGFVANRNIFNSDNFRYLVFLIIPGSLGFGLMMDRIAGLGGAGLLSAAAIAATFAGLMTADLAWYDRRMGWIGEGGWPVRREVGDPARAWLDGHGAVSHLAGDYWDVYRLAFLCGGRFAGVPYPNYPDRFPESSRGLPGGRPRLVLIRPSPLGRQNYAEALSRGGRVVGRAGTATFVERP